MDKPVSDARASLFQNTPTVVVHNNQGLLVRELSYYRAEAEKAPEIRISLHRYDHAGYLKTSVDARLSELYLKNPSSVIPNQQQYTTLSGNVLQSKNVDAGMRVHISDVQGQAMWEIDSLGTEREFDYDKLKRIAAINEKAKEKPRICCERFVYGEKEGNNSVGQLIEHYDTAGLREVTGYSVLGAVVGERRRFLENPDVVNWPSTVADRQTQLETGSYTAAWGYNGLGELVSQTDAKGNLRLFSYTLSGQLGSSFLQIANGKSQKLSDYVRYDANGQLQEEKLGNGVTKQYSYEHKTQRLSRVESTRQNDMKTLQDLNYQYDPVGNVIEVTDKAQAVGFYANTKTETVNYYTYDSLYQLVEATGIESQKAGQETNQLPDILSLGNPDASRCVNYTRNYRYDAGANLYEIRHVGAKNYTQSLTIDSHSNRGIEKRETGPTLQQSFDANGNCLYVNTDQPLSWDTRNQLQRVIQLQRADHSDEETYRYDGTGQRVEKITRHVTSNQIHTDRVRYLPGIELREHWQTDVDGKNKKITEQFCSIQAGNGVRALHWEAGKPTEMENDALRYTLTDQLGSRQLELTDKGEIISYESYYPYGGTAIWSTKNQIEANYKFVRYSGKERDATGFYYYGYRYYLPWLGRWLNADPSGIAEGLNLFRMSNNNPITFVDGDGAAPKKLKFGTTVETFSSLYPETKERPIIAGDPFSGKTYRPIKKSFFIFPDEPQRAWPVDVQVFGIGIPENERMAYLFTQETPSKRLLVDSHGCFPPQDVSDIIHLEQGMPSFIVLGPHGEVLESEVQFIEQNYAKISPEGIVLTSEQAREAFEQEGYAKITGTDVPYAIRNYHLEKLTPPILSFAQHDFETQAAEVSFSREEQNFDILTVRKNRGRNVTFADILKGIEGLGYEEVVLNFCRSPIGMLESEEEIIYAAQDTILLSAPITKTF